MKIGVIKLGARITWDTDGAVAPGEAISICKALVQGGAEVHVFTKILAKDTLDPSIHWHNILEDQTASEMDLLLIINGNVNFFGGAEDEAQILNYKVLNNFAGPAVYVMCDPELPFMQIWESVEKKPWGGKYKKSDIFVEKDNLYLLSQPFAVDKVLKDWEGTKRSVKIAGAFHFPMERFPLLNEWHEHAPQPATDLLYGGTARGGRRIPNLYKWYWNLPEDISVEIFGSIDADDFLKHPKVGPARSFGARAPEFSGKVKYSGVLPKMNGALAHLVTGDPSYERLDIIPQRTYECIAAGNVVFVDAAMDPSRRIYPRGTLAHDYLYVKTQEELVERLRTIKDNQDLRDQVLVEQRQATSFDPDHFCRSLVKTLSTYVQ